jgi:molybdopterin-containing oxidoreductase family iron-sulfur binding subunit
VRSWDEVARALQDGPWAKSEGQGLHLHLEPTSSPTAIALLGAVRRRLPRVGVSFDHGRSANAWQGARLAFGQIVEPILAPSRADVIVALDADFLTTGPAWLRNARELADRRAAGIAPGETMPRLYVVEPLVTVTGMNADHRLRVRAADVGAIAASIAEAVRPPELPDGVPPVLASRAEAERAWIEAVARDLLAHRGRGLVIVGEAQPPEVHALAHALNASLGNVGVTVGYVPSPVAEAGEHAPGALEAALARGEIDTLVVTASNPVYASPRGGEIERLLRRTPRSAYLGVFEDETAGACTFSIARAHPLESWGDARAFDGTVSIVQPLIEPLYDARTELEVLGLFAGEPARTAHELIRDRFRSAAARRQAVTKAPELELVSRLDPRVHDGRFAGNAWLLELPAPATKLTWMNAATLSSATAARLGVDMGDDVELRLAGGSSRVRVHACVVAGQADDTVGLTLGWGRRRGLAHGRGANAYPLAGRGGVVVKRTGTRERLPITQRHRSLEGRDRDVLRHGTLAEVRAEPPAPTKKKRLSLYDVPLDGERQWGMAIDLTRCIGCEACVIAVAIAIAFAKALFVLVIFMELARERTSVKLSFAAAALLLTALIGLIIGDLATREAPPLAPYGAEQRGR